MEHSENMQLKNARKRVEALKGFYRHLLLYIIINVALFIIRGNILDFFQNKNHDINFMEWIDWNILFVPLFWGIGLLFHAAKVFQHKNRFLIKWEEKQMKKSMEQENLYKN